MIKRVLNLGLLLLVGLLFTNFSQAQPPQKMTYQVVVRDAQNNLVVNQQIGVRISIVKSSLDGRPSILSAIWQRPIITAYLHFLSAMVYRIRGVEWRTLSGVITTTILKVNLT